ncbi:MAG: hypothetical protein ACE5H4_12915 [Candidatus Thorarchaeota archaeon]
MHEEEGLDKLLRLRAYEKLHRDVDARIRRRGWPSVAEEINSIPFKTVGYNVPYKTKSYDKRVFLEEELRRNPQAVGDEITCWGLRPGKIRDGFISILGLESVIGLDVEFLNAFGKIDAESLNDLQARTSFSR